MPQINKILVPTDFSDNAQVIYELAQRTAAKHQATVDLIHVVPDAIDFSFYEEVLDNPRSVRKNQEQLQTKLTAKLDALLKENFEDSQRGKVIIASDSKPAEGIAAYANEQDYDLIAIAPKGHGNSIFNRGSVTEKIIQLCNIPVLSSSSRALSDINTILMTTDGSKVSFEALPMAMLFAEANQAEIHLLSVIHFESINVQSIGKDARIHDYAANHLKNDVIEGLLGYVKDAKGMELVDQPSQDCTIIKTKGGDPVKIYIVLKDGLSIHNTIVEYAKKEADMAVISTHGRSGLAKLFIGSVAGKVIQQLKMPLLTITPKFAQKKVNA